MLRWVFAVIISLFATSGLADCKLPAPHELVFGDEDLRIVAAVGPKANGEAAIAPFGLVVGQQFSLLLQPCDLEIEVKHVDARMPSHGHGMNYKPLLSRNPSGQIIAEGLLFHMPGLWEIVVDIQKGGEEVRFTRQVMLKP